MTAQDKLATNLAMCPKCNAAVGVRCKDGGTCLERRAEAINILAGLPVASAAPLIPHDEELTLP